ncbi:MAG: hypothetical protein RBJ76_22290 [Stenomitos frigidus ULC029]
MVATSTPRSIPHFPQPPFSLALAETLLDTYGSPLYVYEGDRLRQTIQHITQAIPYPRTRFHFASVTNGNVALLQIFREAGWGLHANTPGDIYLGLHAGFHPSQMIYSGSNLDRAEMEQLFQWGITTLNLDSLAQLQLCCETWQALALEKSQQNESTPPPLHPFTPLPLHPFTPPPFHPSTPTSDSASTAPTSLVIAVLECIQTTFLLRWL